MPAALVTEERVQMCQRWAERQKEAEPSQSGLNNTREIFQSGLMIPDQLIQCDRMLPNSRLLFVLTSVFLPVHFNENMQIPHIK